MPLWVLGCVLYAAGITVFMLVLVIQLHRVEKSLAEILKELEASGEWFGK